MFGTVLVANRGEIAVRVITTLRAMGIRSVAVYSDADVDGVHVRAADVAIRLGEAPARASYLDIAGVVAAALDSGADAVHPGYGFLSEHAGFATACAAADLVFIGPPAEVIATMGDKFAAKAVAAAADVATVPGAADPGDDPAAMQQAAQQIGFPVLVKAIAGGGGKGLRVVTSADDLLDSVAAARREAQAAFGDDRVLIERYLPRARHIEVQVLADAHGGVVTLGERECSLQRRHQKLVEESPSVVFDADQDGEDGHAARTALCAAAARITAACGYRGVGTVEFITDGQGREPWFLEMNTRLQVEHGVTEARYGLDLVEWQLRVASGQRLAFGQDDLTPRGHAIEARVCAEDPGREFLPTGGRVLAYREPDRVWPALSASPGVRSDSGIAAGSVVGLEYDSLLAKVIVHADDRATALDQLRRALGQFHVLGVVTNTRFLRVLLADDDVRAGRLDTAMVARKVDGPAALAAQSAPAPGPHVFAAAGLACLAVAQRQVKTVRADAFARADGWRLGGFAAWSTWRFSVGDHDPVTVAVRGPVDDAEVVVGDDDPLPAVVQCDGDELSVTVAGARSSYVFAVDGDTVWLGGDQDWCLTAVPKPAQWTEPGDAAAGAPLAALVAPLPALLRAPLPGTVVAVNVAVGDVVIAQQPLLLIEAMKMEHPVRAPAGGSVTEVHVAVGDKVALGTPVIVVTAITP